MKFMHNIRQLRYDAERELRKNGYFCLFGMHSHGDHSSYVNEVYNAIDVMTHEIQLRVTVNVRGQVSDTLLGLPRRRSSRSPKGLRGR